MAELRRGGPLSGLKRHRVLCFCSLASGLCFFLMRSFSYNSGFSIFTIIGFTDLFPFCLFHQFASVSPAVPEFLKTPTTADQHPPRSTAPVLPPNTVSSAKPGPALVKVGAAFTPDCLSSGLSSAALCPEHRGVCPAAWSPAALKTKP